MSPQAIRVLVLAAFVLFLFVVISLAVGSDTTQTMARAEFSISWIGRAIGIFLASIAGLLLLLKSVGKPSLNELAVLVVTLLAGVLLIERHWAVAVSLGAAVLGVVVKEVITFLYVDSNGNESEDSEADEREPEPESRIQP